MCPMHQGETASLPNEGQAGMKPVKGSLQGYVLIPYVQ
jgi:hypothetical protein